jgi:hypothetical protein
MREALPAPAWTIAHWLNTQTPLSVEALRGKVIFAVAFQMLCPGCVSQGLPQAQRVRAAFDPRELAVIGLHTVFEHHKAQGSREALAAFLHEYRIDFPVGLDAQAGAGVPVTMHAYQMQGTPTTILIDRDGRLRMQKFGHFEDLHLGAVIASLIGEVTTVNSKQNVPSGSCTPDGCQ